MVRAGFRSSTPLESTRLTAGGIGGSSGGTSGPPPSRSCQCVARHHFSLSIIFPILSAINNHRRFERNT